MKPTEAAYQELQVAFDHFNQTLFEGVLPPCLITFQREKRTFGYFSTKRFVTATGETTDEIAMNPAFFAVSPVGEIMQTLVHEMAHMWQEHFGDPGRRRYHNAEWAEKMESIGLMPSDTGKPGGKKTGEKMMDYSIPGGQFERACAELIEKKFQITWMDRFPVIREGTEVPAFIRLDGDGGEGEAGPLTPVENKSNRVKYQCPPCEINVWGKPGLAIICGTCNGEFVAEGSSATEAADEESALKAA